MKYKLIHFRTPYACGVFFIKTKNILANHFLNPIFARFLKFKQNKIIQNAK